MYRVFSDGLPWAHVTPDPGLLDGPCCVRSDVFVIGLTVVVLYTSVS